MPFIARAASMVKKKNTTVKTTAFIFFIIRRRYAVGSFKKKNIFAPTILNIHFTLELKNIQLILQLKIKKWIW